MLFIKELNFIIQNFLGFFLLAVASVYFFHNLFYLLFALGFNRHPPHAYKKLKPLPKVTVQLPIRNEGEVVKDLIGSVTKIDYPKNLLEIQVLDDSNGKEGLVLKSLVKKCKNLGLAIKYYHRLTNKGFKAGNLNFGLKKARGEFLLILDADFLLSSDFLKKTINYFSDQDLALIQARWQFVNKKNSVLTRLNAALLNHHSLIDQWVRGKVGMLIKFQGSGALIRKKALVEVGGWDEDLLAEDIALSYLLQLHHWKILFLPEVVVSCQLPNNLKDYTAQQFKWIRGLMETFLKISGKIISSSLPILKKIEALLQLGRRGIYAFWGALFVVYLFWALVFPSSQFFSIFPLLLISLFLLYLTFALAIAFSNWIFGERLPAALFWGLSIWILFFLTTVTDFLATLEAVLGRQTKAWPRVKKFYLKRG